MAENPYWYDPANQTVIHVDLLEGRRPFHFWVHRPPALHPGDEVAPLWALCSDCLFGRAQTCPEMPQCWSPQKTADLPQRQP